MSVVQLRWGSKLLQLERNQISTLTVLKEYIQSQTGIDSKCQTLFYRDDVIEKESDLADAIESDNPTIYIHSQPSIKVYLKMGWILKSLNVYLFYSVEYISYLALDIIEDVYGANTTESFIHLVLRGRVLENPKATLYSVGVKQGDVLEVCISDNNTIASILYRPKPPRESFLLPQDDGVDLLSILSCRLVFLQIGRGEQKVPISTITSALEYWYPLDDIQGYLQSACHLNSSKTLSTKNQNSTDYMVSEVEFVSILCMLQNGSKKLSPALQDLLSHDRLSPLMIPDGKVLLDMISTKGLGDDRKFNRTSMPEWKWVIPYDSVHRYLSSHRGDHLIENNQLWTVSRSVVQKIGDEKGKGKKSVIMELMHVVGIGEEGDTEVSILQMLVFMFLLDKALLNEPIPQPLPSSLAVLLV